MLSLIALLNYVANTFLDSLKRDLSQSGFEIVILIFSISVVSSPLLALGLFFLHKFQMPTDPYFYLLWLGVTLTTAIQFSLFVVGMVKTKFLAANTFSTLAFVTTAIYAVIFLHETVSILQILAIAIGLAGALLFFNWRSVHDADNSGLLIVFFSIFLSPLASIFYKAAALHTASYHEFLTGRAVMDLAYYSVFFLLLFIFWYKRNPFPQMISFARKIKGASYTLGEVAVNLVTSYLFFMMPVALLTMLSTVSIPAGYLIGHIKYGERIDWRYIFGAILIILAVVLFIYN